MKYFILFAAAAVITMTAPTAKSVISLEPGFSSAEASIIGKKKSSITKAVSKRIRQNGGVTGPGN